MFQILNTNQSYTFSKIFELKIEPKDLAEYFGYNLTRKRLKLPQYKGELDNIKNLIERLENILPHVSLANETARREILISPVILELIYYTKSELRIEYPLKVSEQLQGYLDYLLENNHNLLVIEAKKEDLDYGMTQLISELIALDNWEKYQEKTTILGAVTTGTIWQFAKLNSQEKLIEQGLNLYRITDDLEILMRILIASLIN